MCVNNLVESSVILCILRIFDDNIKCDTVQANKGHSQPPFSFHSFSFSVKYDINIVSSFTHWVEIICFLLLCDINISTMLLT